MRKQVYMITTTCGRECIIRMDSYAQLRHRREEYIYILFLEIRRACTHVCKSIECFFLMRVCVIDDE